MPGKEQVKEIREAMKAGHRAFASLKNAQDSLKSAGSWGMFDILCLEDRRND